MYFDKLDNIVNEYDNIYHRTIKMTPIDVTPTRYIKFSTENHSDPKFEIDHDVRKGKYKNVFAKYYTPN